MWLKTFFPFFLIFFIFFSGKHSSHIFGSQRLLQYNLHCRVPALSYSCGLGMWKLWPCSVLEGTLNKRNSSRYGTRWNLNHLPWGPTRNIPLNRRSRESTQIWHQFSGHILPQKRQFLSNIGWCKSLKQGL